MVGYVSWGEDTLVEGVEHVEGTGKWIGVPVEIGITIKPEPLWEIAVKVYLNIC